LEKGSGFIPEVGDDITCSVIGYYLEEEEGGDGREFVQFEDVGGMVVRLGEGDVCPGFY